MRLRNYVIGGLCSAVIVAQGASTPGGNDPAVGDDGLDVVPEDNLKGMRGGVDLGNLVGYFAIDRVVQVDGQVVAKMQIVVSNLDKLSTGGMPTVSVTGPLSELVQVMNGPAGSSGGNAAAAATAAAKTIADPQTGGSANAAAGVSGSSGSAGSTAAGQAGAGTFTINVGSGTTVVPATGTSATVTNNTQATQGAAGTASANATSTASGGSGQSSAASETISKVISIGNTGQFVVVSNLPSSAGIATAIQNEVRGTLVNVQTTITAQLNGLTMLNSANLANALRNVGNIPTTTGTGH
jgi:hypothetical protein